MEFKDYYKILGLARGATQDDIKRAYRRLARRYHPDVSKEPRAEERFKQISEAYEALRDPEKRAAYDSLLNGRWREGQEFRPPPGWDSGFEFSGAKTGGAGERFSEFFESLFGGMGVRGARRRSGMRGQDHDARIKIRLEDAFHGATRAVTLQQAGSDAGGRVALHPRTLNVKIPPGVTEGQRIRLAGQGGQGDGGARRGDLYLEILFEPHPFFKADGRDIHLDLPITPWESALGAQIPVPTLGGKVQLRIPPGTQSGQRLRLKGRGLPGKTPGDQYVTVQIHAPKAETAAQRRLYEELARAMPFNPRNSVGG